MTFTYKAYQHLLAVLFAYEYNICSYHNWQQVERPCIMRHDVDFDMDKAVTFAKREAAFTHKCSATYFVLVSTPMYNIASTKIRRAIQEIIGLGHEVGLHFDETQYDLQQKEHLYIEAIEAERHLLSLLTNQPIRVVSMHRPSSFVLEQDLKVPGMVNSYASKFFKQFKYLSDSRRFWREDVLSVVQQRQFSQLHILTHPFWYGEAEEDAKTLLQRFVTSASIERYNDLANNFANLQEFFPMEELQ